MAGPSPGRAMVRAPAPRSPCACQHPEAGEPGRTGDRPRGLARALTARGCPGLVSPVLPPQASRRYDRADVAHADESVGAACVSCVILTVLRLGITQHNQQLGKTWTDVVDLSLAEAVVTQVDAFN